MKSATTYLETRCIYCMTEVCALQSMKNTQDIKIAIPRRDCDYFPPAKKLNQALNLVATGCRHSLGKESFSGKIAQKRRSGYATS